MPISIVTVNWNGEAILPDYLDALSAQTVAPHEVIVVDNGSTDASVSFLELFGAKVIALPENRGFCEPNNIGTAHAGGDAVLLLNNDTFADPHLIESLEMALERHPKMDLFACSMRRWDRPEIMENAGIGYRKTLSGYQVGRNQSAAEWAEEQEVFGPSGGAALIRTAVLRDIGLFDPAFFAYNEDVDFALRARLAGYKCLYLPQAVVRHHEGITARRLGRRKLMLNQRNAEWAMRKNVPGVIQRRLAVWHALYVMQQAARNGWQAPTVLAARRYARKHPRPRGGPRRVDISEFTKWLDVVHGPATR